MKQSVEIIDNDPVLITLDKELEALKKTCTERLKFLQRQSDALADEMNGQKQELWDKIERHLIDIGKMPKNYDKKKHSICIQAETNLVYICDKDEKASGMPEELKKLLMHILT